MESLSLTGLNLNKKKTLILSDVKDLKVGDYLLKDDAAGK